MRILYSDLILKIVKLVITVEFIFIPLKFILDDGNNMILIFNNNLLLAMLLSFVVLVIYFFATYYEAKKLVICTGCKVANTGANVVIYTVVLILLFITHKFL